jgi:FSR family fosmidomycin resistance protein-like MFS transporter
MSGSVFSAKVLISSASLYYWRVETEKTGRFTAAFSCVGHFCIHFCTAFFFVIVLALERDWNLPYHELVRLWTLGALLVGVAALPAGLLSDRFGASPMMVVFFVGLGGSSVAAGLARSPAALMVALTGIGVFASIYHPVGIPWLVRNTPSSRGTALGINGVFGTLGSALSAVVTGALIDTFGWPTAFRLPGIFCLLAGAALVVCMATGLVSDRKVDSKTSANEPATDSRRVFGVLVVTMFVAGLIFHSTQTSLPKLIELRDQGLAGKGALGVGLLVALVYGAAGIMQILGGHLADRLPLKQVYAGAIFVQVPMLFLAASVGGVLLIVVATLMVMANAAALPAENMLLARHTPEHRHGLAFGVKFVLSFGAAPLAVELASFVSEKTGEFQLLYLFLSISALTAFLFALLLPRSSDEQTLTIRARSAPSA